MRSRARAAVRRRRNGRRSSCWPQSCARAAAACSRGPRPSSRGRPRSRRKIKRWRSPTACAASSPEGRMVTAPEWAHRLPRRRRGAIPLSDADAVRFALRRTTLVRLALAGLLVALGALAVWRAAVLNPRPVSFLPSSTTSVVVLDQSKSVYISSYRRIAQMLRKLVAADVPVGLVAFSDTAYEMLPPGARGSELKPLLRFYTPGHGGSNVDPETLYAANPWQDVFSGGTKISAGLDMARSLLHRDHIRNGTVLLASHLETAGEDE